MHYRFILRESIDRYISGHIERDVIDHDPRRTGSQIGEEEVFKVVIDKVTIQGLDPMRWTALLMTHRSLVLAILSIRHEAASHRLEFVDASFSIGDYDKALDELESKPPQQFRVLAIFAGVIAVVVGSLVMLAVYISARDHLHRNPPDTPNITRSIDVKVDSVKGFGWPVTGLRVDTVSVTITDKRIYIYKTLTNEQKNDLRKTIKD
jgi:hypothetical protein